MYREPPRLSGRPALEELHKDSPVDMVSPHSISAALSLLLYLD